MGCKVKGIEVGGTKEFDLGAWVERGSSFLSTMEEKYKLFLDISDGEFYISCKLLSSIIGVEQSFGHLNIINMHVLQDEVIKLVKVSDLVESKDYKERVLEFLKHQDVYILHTNSG